MPDAPSRSLPEYSSRQVPTWVSGRDPHERATDLLEFAEHALHWSSYSQRPREEGRERCDRRPDSMGHVDKFWWLSGVRRFIS